MSPNPIVWLRERDVVDLVDLNEAIAALESALLAEGRGSAINVPKALGTWNSGSSLHSLGSIFTDAAYCGCKTWVNTPRGATAIFVLFDGDQGTLLAIIEAGALGMMRTAGIAGLATRWLADADADEMALVGTGRQAMMQVAAVAAVRPLRRLKVYSRTAESRARFAADARRAFDFEVVACDALRAATRDTPIVTLVTRATEPFLSAEDLSPGTHLNAVGAVLPANAEFMPDVFGKADLVVTDNLANLRKASREFVEHFENTLHDWSAVRTLGEVIASDWRRPAEAHLTLFKAMGMGVSDLAVAVRAYEKAWDRGVEGVGLTIDHPILATPRWSALGDSAG